MARTQIPVLVALANQADGIEIHANDVAVDDANDMYFVNRGGRTLLIIDSGATSGVDVTIVSVKDPYGRTEDLGPTTVGADTLNVFGPFTPLLFNQKDGSDQVFVNFATLSGTVTALGIQYPAV